MINGKKVLAIIPARGGSKGIPRKNIKILAGKPLIAWTIEEAKKSKYIDRLILSSEDDEIIQVAKEWGCEVPFVRPKELSTDDTPGIYPVIHAIKNIEEKFDYVCLLQPTSPLRKSKNIDECIEKCFRKGADSCVTITEVDQHPFWMYELNKKDKIIPIFVNKTFNKRQDLPKLYILNGAVYLAKCELILKNKSFINNNTIGLVMEKHLSLDIDDIIDFALAEKIIKESL